MIEEMMKRPEIKRSIVKAKEHGKTYNKKENARETCNFIALFLYSF